MPVDICIDRNSSVPLHEQIKDRIKLGLALGTLRPGDNLPSIRQLDEKLHIGTTVIRRSYRELADIGILDLQHGRGVFIKNGIHSQAAAMVREYDVLYNLISRELNHANLVPATFARFVYGRILDAERQTPSIAIVEDSKSIATDYAAQLSQEWQVPISSFTLEELRHLPPLRRADLRRVITSYYHIDEVREIMRKHRGKVIPVDIEFAPATAGDLRSLAPGSQVVWVIHAEDYAHLRPYVGSFVEETFGGGGLHFDFVSSDQVNIPDLLNQGRFALVFLSNRIWDGLDDAIRSSPLARRPMLRITQQSVKSAWASIGVI
ncbi:MAG: GntR family transcriptional regulator [Acidobacteria bacterium]|nr:GntR family transcriptional regulator [Acidobacteriota bacterium]